MIPIGDLQPRRRFPWVTIGLVAVNLAAFLYQRSLPPRQWETLIMQAGVVPLQLTTAPDGAALRSLVTAMFLHGGWMHLLSNMLYLWIFGDNIEGRLSHLPYLAFYLASGVAASLAHVAVYPRSLLPMIGASGAVSGVLGAYLVLYPRVPVRVLVFLFRFIRIVHLPALLVLGLWFAMQLLSGMASLGDAASGGVAWFAHIGGFAGGLAMGLAIKVADLRGRRGGAWA